MNILFIAPYIPSRIRVRPFHFINELSKKHNVIVVALGDENSEEAAAARDLNCSEMHIVSLSKTRAAFQCLVALPTPAPLCAAYCYSSAARKTIAQIVEKHDIDIVHIEHIRAAHFARDLRNYNLVFDAVDCLTGLFSKLAKTGSNPISRALMSEEAWKLKTYEPQVMRMFDRAIITSEREKKEVNALAADIHIDVVPNGVDTQYFVPAEAESDGKRIVFSGKMGYRPNADAAFFFATEVFPLVQNEHPDAEFIIAGSGPDEKIRGLGKTNGITVTGFVEDLRPYLQSARVAVTPMQVAVGIQNKALEAMSCGTPVVASSAVGAAFTGEPAGLVSADGAEDTAQAVSKLLHNPKEATELGKKAREYVLANYSWGASVEMLESIYEEVIAVGKNAGGLGK